MAEEPVEKVDNSYTAVPPVTDLEREYGCVAMHEFERGMYAECLLTLNEIMDRRATDVKVHHNKLVAEYCQSGHRNTDQFRQGLNTVCDMCQINLDNVNNLDDVDYCVLYYNYALILYHIKQYRLALTVVDKLFQYIEPLEETLTRQVLFLTVELYLATQQPEKAHAILSFTEKTLFGNGTKSQHPTPEKDKGDLMKESPPDTTTVNEIWRPKISQYKVRCYLMLKSVKACKREIKNLMSSVGLGPQIVYLKSNFEYVRGNYRKTIKLLNTAPKSDSEENLSMMYYNNLGCIHFNMRKHHLGAFYFRKAFEENQKATKSLCKLDLSQSLSGPPISKLNISRHNELVYNTGIQLLYGQKPAAAFDCLLEAVQTYHRNPRLWLRLAECCVQVHRENNDEDRRLAKRLEVVRGCVGSGVHRRLILGDGIVNTHIPCQSPAVPALTLEFASLCLKNALMLLPDDKMAPPVLTDDINEQEKMFDVPIPAPPANPIRGQEIISLRSSIYCQSAYVSLCLNDYLMAARFADRLLKQTKLSGAHRYLGHMYMSEALLSLDKIADAIYHLNPESVTDISVLLPETKQDQDKSEHELESKGCLSSWSPADVPHARAVMQFNLATAHAIRGEHEKAVRHLASSANNIGSPFPAHLYFLMLYLDLIDGQRKRAQTVIKEQFGHMTPNRA